MRHIKDVYSENRAELDAIPDGATRERRFIDLNVVVQAHNVCKTSIVQNAWNKGEFPHVHGWVYDIRDGIIRTLGKDFKVHSNDPTLIYKFLHE